MTQYQTIMQFYHRMQDLCRQLDATPLDDRQQALLDEIHKESKTFGDFVMEDYIGFEEIGDNLPDTIYLYVADRYGKTVYISELYTQMSGISRTEIIGKNVFQINKEKKLYSNGVLPYVLREQKPVETIGVMLRTNIKVHLTGVPIFDARGELKYAFAFGSNIQQLETIKDQLTSLQVYQEKQKNEVHYLRTQQIGNVDVVMNSAMARQALETAISVAKTDATVLITGESGTGKEVIANQIVQASKRADQPFIRVNCGAIPESLMESELFGYEPGSFTGASKSGKTGIFELANSGTLLLDEIGEMSLQMQTRLLRVLQNHEITRIGGAKAIPVDVRIIASTNKDLQQAIRKNEFREDLYYRLNVVPIHMPPLRERREDIEPLVQSFLNRYNRKYNKQIDLKADAMQLMTTYDWPGNIRELQNVIERLVVISQTDAIDTRVVSMMLGAGHEAPVSDHEDSGYDLKAATTAVESRLIKKALEDFPSIRKAAAALGIDHSTLIKKCRKYGIESS
ncbi:MAG: sigma 54-interacting transcriptional regulator [Lachnospiraceae bacterium]|nr:sigma 54-interacting transcriptional regulator [Lachnospiraceae bacterium]